MYGHVRQVMTHMLTLHCSTQGAGDSSLTSSRGPLVRDWLGATIGPDPTPTLAGRDASQA